MFSLFISVLFAFGHALSNPLDNLTPMQKLKLAAMIKNSDLSGLAQCIPGLAGIITGGASSIDTNKIMADISTAASLLATTSKCNDLDLSDQCAQDCMHYNHPLTLFADYPNINQTKLFQVLAWYEASASGIGWYDVGNPDQCSYNGGTYCFTPVTNSYDISQGNYPRVAMPHGCCAPGSCTGEDAEKVVQLNPYCFEAFNATALPMAALMGGTQVVAVCEVPERDTTSFGFVLTVLIFILFVTAVIVASSLYVYRIRYKAVGIDNELAENLNGNGQNQNQMDLDKIVRDNSGFLRIFSIQCIWDTFTGKRPKGKQDLNFLDGIRVFSMSWVILGHSYFYFFLNNGSNTLTLAPFAGDSAPNSDVHPYVINRFGDIFVQYAFYSVDSFFWLSGLLGAFSLYRNISKIGGGDVGKISRSFYSWIPMSYCTRYLRIVPMMMFVTLIQWKISDQLPSGPHTIARGANDAGCSDSVWRILTLTDDLYLSRHGDTNALSCMGHLWYVQCDFQMFLLLPWLVLIFINHRMWGIIASLIPYLTCLIIRFYDGFYYHFSANFILGGTEVIHDGNESVQSYFKPWTRMGPYFIGVTCMFIMITINEKYQQNQQKFVLLKETFYVILGTALFILFSLVIWPWDDVKDAPERRWNVTQNAVYYAFSRPMWGLGLSLLAIALRYSRTNTLIKQFLSFEIYQSVGKLTYVMYLIHLILYQWWSDDVAIPSYYSGWFILLLFFGIWCMTFLCALVLHLFMESPINSIISMYLKCVKNYGCCCCCSSSKRIEGNGRRGRNVNEQSVSIQMNNNVNANLNMNQQEQVPYAAFSEEFNIVKAESTIE